MRDPCGDLTDFHLDCCVEWVYMSTNKTKEL